MTGRTARSISTRRHFADVALRFQEKGYAQTSMAQIAQAAGGSRARAISSCSARVGIYRLAMSSPCDLRCCYDDMTSPRHPDPAV